MKPYRWIPTGARVYRFGEQKLLGELRALQQVGHCMFCDEPLPPSKGTKPRTVMCGDMDCLKTYWRLHHHARRDARCEGR